MCRLSSITPVAVCLFQMYITATNHSSCIVTRDDVISDKRSVSIVNDPQPQTILRLQMIPKMDRK